MNTLEYSRFSRREMSRWLVGWMERAGFGSADARRKFLQAVELLPDTGSLSLACARGSFFEDRGVKNGRGKQGGGLDG